MNIADITKHYESKNASWLESHLAGLDAIGREMPPGLFTEMEMHKIRLIVAAAVKTRTIRLCQWCGEKHAVDDCHNVGKLNR